MTKKQKLVLMKISHVKNKMTMSFLAERLSDELKFGKTTARIILQTLRDVGLISCGSSRDKGKPVKLTKIGKIVINRSNKEEMKR
jgi:transcription initiation factor IIE alpha subunit